MKESSTDKNIANDKDATSPPNTLFRYLESSLIITLISTSLYFIGYGYYSSFFGRLSLPHNGLNLPISFYFQDIWPIWLFGIFIILISFYFGYKKPPTNFMEAAFGNLVVIITSIIGIIWLLPTAFEFNAYNSITASKGVLTFLFIIFFCTVSAGKKHFSLAHFFYKFDSKGRLIIVMFYILFIFILASFYGNIHATLLLGGFDGQEASLELNEKNNDMQSKSLMLVLHYDRNYYLVEKNISLPKYPLMYIVPDDQVKIAKVHRIR